MGWSVSGVITSPGRSASRAMSGCAWSRQEQLLGYVTQNATSFLRNGHSNVGEHTPARGGRGASPVLPSVNLQLQPHEDVKARFAYSQTMDLPTFEACADRVDRGDDPDQPGQSAGSSPQLPPFFPASPRNWQSIPSRRCRKFRPVAGMVSKPGHHVPSGRIPQANYQLPIRSLTQRRSRSTLRRRINNKDVIGQKRDRHPHDNATVPAKVKGIEIGARTFFDMLPALWRLRASRRTTPTSTARTRATSTSTFSAASRTRCAVQGLSKNNYNVTLMYERGRVSARVA